MTTKALPKTAPKKVLQKYKKAKALPKVKPSKASVAVEGDKLPVQTVVLLTSLSDIKKDIARSGTDSKTATLPIKRAGRIVEAMPNVDRRKTLPADYEYVNHPAHYGKHPSGVEAIELCEVLSFNVGSAFKYVYRRDDKANAIQDLQKARWYIVREIELLKATWRRFLPSWINSMLLTNPDMGEHHYELADRIRVTEKNTHAKLFYNAVLISTETGNYASQDLPAAVKAIDALIQVYSKEIK